MQPASLDKCTRVTDKLTGGQLIDLLNHIRAAVRKRYGPRILKNVSVIFKKVWDYMPSVYGRNAGLRLDHLQLRARLSAGGVDLHVRGLEKRSDHTPTWIEPDDL